MLHSNMGVAVKRLQIVKYLSDIFNLAAQKSYTINAVIQRATKISVTNPVSD